MDRDQAIKLMQDLLRRVVEKKASDLFITAGFPPAIKIDGEIRPQSERALTMEQSATLVRAIMNDRQTKEFDASKECNFAIAPPGIGRFRVSAVLDTGVILPSTLMAGGKPAVMKRSDAFFSTTRRRRSCMSLMA